MNNEVVSVEMSTIAKDAMSCIAGTRTQSPAILNPWGRPARDITTGTAQLFCGNGLINNYDNTNDCAAGASLDQPSLSNPSNFLYNSLTDEIYFSDYTFDQVRAIKLSTNNEGTVRKFGPVVTHHLRYRVCVLLFQRSTATLETDYMTN